MSYANDVITFFLFLGWYLYFLVQCQNVFRVCVCPSNVEILDPPRGLLGPCSSKNRNRSCAIGVIDVVWCLSWVISYQLLSSSVAEVVDLRVVHMEYLL